MGSGADEQIQMLSATVETVNDLVIELQDANERLIKNQTATAQYLNQYKGADLPVYDQEEEKRKFRSKNDPIREEPALPTYVMQNNRLFDTKSGEEYTPFKEQIARKAENASADLFSEEWYSEVYQNTTAADDNGRFSPSASRFLARAPKDEIARSWVYKNRLVDEMHDGSYEIRDVPTGQIVAGGTAGALYNNVNPLTARVKGTEEDLNYLAQRGWSDYEENIQDISAETAEANEKEMIKKIVMEMLGDPDSEIYQDDLVKNTIKTVIGTETENEPDDGREISENYAIRERGDDMAEPTLTPDVNVTMDDVHALAEFIDILNGLIMGMDEPNENARQMDDVQQPVEQSSGNTTGQTLPSMMKPLWSGSTMQQPPVTTNKTKEEIEDEIVKVAAPRIVTKLQEMLGFDFETVNNGSINL